MFRIKLRSPIGTVYSQSYAPARGVPQGGVLSPLLWLLRVNKIVEDAIRQLHREVDLPPPSWNVIVQFFANDISAAIGHERKPAAVALAYMLIFALLRQLK